MMNASPGPSGFGPAPGTLFKVLADYENGGSLVNRFRNSRFRFFEECLKHLGDRELTLLDVGGNEHFWIARGYHGHARIQITLLNLQKETTHYSNLRSIAGNACDMTMFSDREFDVAFSNSVIEHLGTFTRQQAMASEVQRVGHYHFVQTPNRAFFIEPHHLIPWFQFMPGWLQQGLLTKTSLTRHGRISSQRATQLLEEIRLLSGKEFRTLFPRSRMYEERVFSMVKSYTAYNL
jgi:hypothetical protein